MSNSVYQYIEVQRYEEDTIFVIKFNRSESLNAMNRGMMDELVEVAENLEREVRARVVVITGAGSSFMAGADIKEYASASETEFFAFQRQGVRIYRALEESNLPVLAAVQGYALGGGMEIALACDLILASETAQLGLPEVHLGLVPGGGGTQRLTQKVGINRAKEMLLTGDRYPSQTLRDWGIVNRVFPDQNFFDSVLEFAKKLTRRSRAALAQLKHLSGLSLTGADLSRRLGFEGQICYQLFCGEEARSKIAAFANKSKK